MPSSRTIRKYFGSLRVAYHRVGYRSRYDCSHFETGERLTRIQQEVMAELISRLERRGATTNWDGISALLVVNHELRVIVCVARHVFNASGHSRWNLHSPPQITADFTMAVRLDRHNQEILDYYLLPERNPDRLKVQFRECNGVYLDAFRFRTLDFLVGMAARVNLPQRL